jgi:hypothetical protein
MWWWWCWLGASSNRNESVHSVISMFQDQTADPKQREEERRKLLQLNKKLAYHNEKREVPFFSMC